MDECDNEPLFFSGQACRASSNAATHDDEINALCRLGDGRGIQHNIAPGAQDHEVIRRLGCGILGEEDRITAPLKAGQVLQSDLAGRCANLDASSLLPRPARDGSEDSLDGFAVEDDLEAAWGFPVARLPIFCADPQAIAACRGEGDRGLGISYGLAHAVCEQIGRAHGVGELLVHDPAALLLKAFSLDEHLVDCLKLKAGDPEHARDHVF